MNKYIFPGADASMPLSFVVKHMEQAGFEIHSVENVGIHYSLTISHWYDNRMKNRTEVTKVYGEWWFRVWQVFLAWSVEIAAQGSSTCFQVVCNKNLDAFQRVNFVGATNLGERDLNVGAASKKKSA
jgi:sphingolipid C9-methyltransferase